jgi:hypothetical protein
MAMQLMMTTIHDKSRAGLRAAKLIFDRIEDKVSRSVERAQRSIQPGDEPGIF